MSLRETGTRAAMKDLKEREREARARLAERLTRLKAERRRELGFERRPGRPAPPPLPRPEPELPTWWWNR
jgi:hypothetical protein